MEDFLVTRDDWREVRNQGGKAYCVRGSREWAQTHNLDFEKFIAEGLMASEFIATGDALALELVRVAREVRSRG